jgi:tRNA (guanine-N7-)-methyltransferase
MSDLTLDAIEQWWPRFGIGEPPRPGHNPRPGLAPSINPRDVFGDAPVVLEIGCGMGEAAVAMAAADPDTGLIAAEVHIRGVARLLRAVDAAGLTNIRTVWADGLALLDGLPDASLAGIRVYFPDPWPKARHHKRRLVRPPFVALAATKLQPGGSLHAATDWADYAEQMLTAMSQEPLLHNASETRDGFLPRPDWRTLTRYEQAGIDKGHTVRDVLFTRTAH